MIVELTHLRALQLTDHNRTEANMLAALLEFEGIRQTPRQNLTRLHCFVFDFFLTNWKPSIPIHPQVTGTNCDCVRK